MKVSAGFPAIRPVTGKEIRQSARPLSTCILASIKEAVEETGLSGVRVILHVPQGAEVGKKTLNSRVGVEGGSRFSGQRDLSNRGTIILKNRSVAGYSAAKNPVITTGRIGLRYARLLFPEREVILVGGKIGEALDAAQGDIILCGLPALILRYINPQILDGTGFATVEEFAASPSFLNR